MAARLQIFSIALESGLAQTLSSCADRIGSTLDSFAQVISALSHSGLLRETLLERVAPQAGLTAAIIAAHSIDADSVLAAQASSAFIDIRAAKEGDASEACQALTHLAAVAIRSTFGVIPTAASVLSIAVLWDRRLAALIGISKETFIANTLVRQAILAVAVETAARAADRWQDRWHAEKVAVTNKAFSAETLVRVGIAGSIQAAGRSIASFPTLAGHAGERLRTRTGS